VRGGCSTLLADGLRRSLSRRPSPAADILTPGVVVFDSGFRVISRTADGERLMELMPGDAVATLYAVAVDASRRDRARSRIRLTDGRWLVAHGARMRGAPDAQPEVTVTLVPAPPADVVSLLLRLHGLSAREREVTQLLMRGPSTDEIAARLYISRNTLHDHTKAIFAKVGAGSRSELMALASDHAYSGAWGATEPCT
jgi:DNA-binding CsgD family transcriptional regulator